jgi:hypothetical protein
VQALEPGECCGHAVAVCTMLSVRRSSVSAGAYKGRQWRLRLPRLLDGRPRR